MKKIITGALLGGLHFATVAGPVNTPGAIASLQAPAQMQFHYDPSTDASILIDPGRTQYTLSVLPVTDPVFALQTILTAMDAEQHVARIRRDTIAAANAASVQVEQQTSDWWLVVEGAELNLFIRVQDAADARAQRGSVEALLQSIRLAPASLPPIVSGNYTIGHSYSDSYDSSFSAFSESGVSLLADGSFTSSSFAGVAGADVSGYSQGEGPGGWWQVRGNRILAFEAPESFYNYRFEAFSNGLELYDENGVKLLWVRN